MEKMEQNSEILNSMGAKEWRALAYFSIGSFAAFQGNMVIAGLILAVLTLDPILCGIAAEQAEEDVLEETIDKKD